MVNVGDDERGRNAPGEATAFRDAVGKTAERIHDLVDDVREALGRLLLSFARRSAAGAVTDARDIDRALSAIDDEVEAFVVGIGARPPGE